MKYPTRRKSPYRHTVHKHTRQNRPVREYERGKGDQPRRPPRPLRTITGHNPVGKSGEFTVRFEYDDKFSDTVSLKARSTRAALEKAFPKRKIPDMPRAVTIMR